MPSYRPRRKRTRTTNSRIARVAKRVIARNIETKQAESTASGTASTTIVSVNLLDPIFNAQGPSSNEFIGNEVRLQSLNIRGYFTQADSSNLMRVVIVRLRGCPVDINNVFLNKGIPLLSLLDNAFVKHVYMDRMVTLNGSTQNDALSFLKRNINFKNRKYHLQNVSDVAESVLMFMVTDSLLPGHPGYKLLWNVKWKDA